MEIGFLLPAERVTRLLNQVVERRGKPLSISSDNGQNTERQAAVLAVLHCICLELVNLINHNRIPI